jgi:DivIVA domain-containing protein
MAEPSETRTERLPGRVSAVERIRGRTFPLAVRGYDRRAVDEFLEEIVELVTDLEGRQSRETLVQRVLDEIGEETASILQRAHETADEIAARSRAQAEGRLQRAEREADITRREAEKHSEQVVVDTRRLWADRQRLIEDMRQLADDVLATADDALERVKIPDLLRDESQPAEPPTAEVELDVLPGGAAEPGPHRPAQPGPVPNGPAPPGGGPPRPAPVDDSHHAAPDRSD